MQSDMYSTCCDCACVEGHTWCVHVIEQCERHPHVGLRLNSPVHVTAAGLLASGEVHVAGEVAPFAEVHATGPPAVGPLLNAACGALLVTQARELAAASPVIVGVKPHPVRESCASERLGEPDGEQHPALVRTNATCISDSVRFVLFVPSQRASTAVSGLDFGRRGLPRRLGFSYVRTAGVPVAPAVGTVLPCLGLVPW